MSPRMVRAGGTGDTLTHGECEEACRHFFICLPSLDRKSQQSLVSSPRGWRGRDKLELNRRRNSIAESHVRQPSSQRCECLARVQHSYVRICKYASTCIRKNHFGFVCDHSHDVMDSFNWCERDIDESSILVHLSHLSNFSQHLLMLCDDVVNLPNIVVGLMVSFSWCPGACKRLIDESAEDSITGMTKLGELTRVVQAHQAQ